ncbi:hypothetical protein AC578_2299 [Pseudocercospora eumusae]|uniref:Secreted protein n=1 Tax=Pseudocercospora eumusae TaxID=321146 RepID=A0A139H114_9PEZI|nr:hypothetical protein AC578_2299 [Pseudocercospora eumusae]
MTLLFQIILASELCWRAAQSITHKASRVRGLRVLSNLSEYWATPQQGTILSTTRLACMFGIAKRAWHMQDLEALRA